MEPSSQSSPYSTEVEVKQAEFDRTGSEADLEDMAARAEARSGRRLQLLSYHCELSGLGLGCRVGDEGFRDVGEGEGGGYFFRGQKFKYEFQCGGSFIQVRASGLGAVK